MARTLLSVLAAVALCLVGADAIPATSILQSSVPTTTTTKTQSRTQDITQLLVPLYADPRRAAELSCIFRMASDPLHSVKWYRDSHEIFRYTPSQEPKIRLFNVSGVAVESGACAEGACTVRLMPAPLAERAAYSCEVSTEGPKFQIARQTKHMTVVAMPERDPVITGMPSTGAVRPGDELLLNCTADPSLPPADISWYVDDKLQKPDPWLGVSTELGASSAAGLRAAWRALRVRAGAAAALVARCEAALRVQPPVVREAAVRVAIYSHARIGKFVAAGSKATTLVCSPHALLAVAWALASVHRTIYL